MASEQRRKGYEISEKPAVLMKAIRDAERSANFLEYQAELISDKEYQKTLAGTREAEAQEIVSEGLETKHEAEKQNIAAKQVSKQGPQTRFTEKRSVVNLLHEKRDYLAASAPERFHSHDDQIRKTEAIAK